VHSRVSSFFHAHRRVLWFLTAALAVGAAFWLDVPAQALFTGTPGTLSHLIAKKVSTYFDFGPLLGATLISLAYAHRNRREDLRRLLAAMILSGLLTGTAALSVRCTTGRTRPCATATQGWYGPMHQGSWLVGVPEYNSFPSGHTVFATALATVPIFAARRRNWPLLALPLTVGWARLHLERHHLSDVVTGFSFGLVGAWFTWRQLMPALEAWFKHRSQMARSEPVITTAEPQWISVTTTNQ
jgi:membrane-associated phospholipid phosphatase